MLHRMLILLVTACLVMGCGQNKFEKEVTTEKLSIDLARQTAKGDYDLITTDELKKLIDEKKEMVLVDTMPFESSFKKGHIPGAVNFHFPIPIMDEWDEKKMDGKKKEDYAKVLGEDKEKLVVIYCGFTKCTRSHNGAYWAKQLGYKNVKRHPGGIYAWRGKKYPVEKE